MVLTPQPLSAQLFVVAEDFYFLLPFPFLLGRGRRLRVMRPFYGTHPETADQQNQHGEAAETAGGRRPRMTPRPLAQPLCAPGRPCLDRLASEKATQIIGQFRRAG